MVKLQRLLLLGFFGVFFSLPATAQVFLFDGPGLRLLCQQGSCVPATRASIGLVQNEQLPDAEFNSQLGAMAAVLFEAARGADELTLLQIAEALRLLALFSTDAGQQASLIQVAGQIAQGGGDLFDLETPFAVSPS